MSNHGSGSDDAGLGRRDAAARLECKVCWYVYDPAQGDDVWHIAPGTPFSALPEHWSCPNCSTTKDQFLVLDDA